MILDHIMNQPQTKVGGSSRASLSIGTKNLMMHDMRHLKDSGVI